VAVGDDVDGEPRFTLLETIRAYAVEQLVAAGESKPLRDGHLAWCVQVAEAAKPELQGPLQGQWLNRLQIEHDNLRAALAWSIEGEGARLQGLRLATALSRYWRMRGHLSEGRTWLERGLAQPDTAGMPVALRARAYQVTGSLSTKQGDYARAKELYQESLQLGRELGDMDSVAESLSNLGTLAQRQGAWVQARALYEESLALRRELGDKWGIAASLNDLGLLASEQDDYERARVLYEESLALARELGHTAAIATLLNNLGNVATSQGDYERAWALDEESLVLRRRIDDKSSLAISLNNLGRVATRLGNYAQAKVLLDEGLALCRTLGDKQGIAHLHSSLGDVATARGDYEQARMLYSEGLAVFRTLGEQLGIADLLQGQGRVAYYQGDYERSRAHYREGLLLQRDLSGKLGAIAILEGLALVTAAEDQPQCAALLWGAAAARRETIRAPLAPKERAEQEQATATLRGALGEEAYADAWAVGQAMGLEEAIAFVLQFSPAT
jgi:tetratricopeptide (TPR) repeat protein